MTQTNPKSAPLLVPEIAIERLSYGPYGISRLDGKAVMIPHTAPGDCVSAQITEDKERYSIGEMTRLIRPSPLRQVPPCQYVGRCGGCSWQHLRYDAQLKAKEQSVHDALSRIGKLRDFELRPIIGSPAESHYRRRIRLQVGGDRQLGFYGAGSHNLIEIDSCWIAAQPLNALIEPLRRWNAELGTVIDHIEIINGDQPHETVAVARANDIFAGRDERLCEELVASANDLAGLIVSCRDGRRIWGQSTITVALHDDLALQLDADVFSQVNPAGNRQMIEQLLRAGNFQPDDRVLELYCGAGNFTLPIARRVKEIVAVEGFRPAITNGTLNAQRYHLDNISWQSAAVPQAVGQLKRQHKSFSKIVLDPPRVGAKGIDGDLAALGADWIGYVSCNPTTLARDLAALAKHGYKLRTVQPIDFFPHSFHVESLAVMTR